MFDIGKYKIRLIKNYDMQVLIVSFLYHFLFILDKIKNYFSNYRYNLYIISMYTI